MRRRRLMVVLLAVLALGAAWWWFATGLSAEERALVGTWRLAEGSDDPSTASFTTDRRAVLTFMQRAGRGTGKLRHEETGTWSVGDGTLVIDPEPSAFRRAIRPVAGLLGLRGLRKDTCRIEMAGDRLTFVGPDGTRTVWIRVPAN